MLGLSVGRKRVRAAAFAAFSAVWCMGFPLAAAEARRPNVLMLVSDDQHAAAIAALGNKDVRTPRLDALAGAGLVMERAFCMGSTVPAVCQPSRAMFLSGRSLNRAPGDLKGTETLPERFRQAGYETFGVGKWHNGQASALRSFGRTGRMMFGGMGDPHALPLHVLADGRFASVRPPAIHATTLFADDCVEFLRAAPADKPFFAYVAFTAPHDPRVPPEAVRKTYDPAKLALPANFLPVHPFDNGEMTIRDELLAPWPRTPDVIRGQLADYYAEITHLDTQIGRIVDALPGKREDTLIVFFSDHGLALGRHGLLGKQSLYDHSMRAPLLISGAGVKPGKSAALTYLFDIAPTVCELAGVEVPTDIDGRSFAPAARVRDGGAGAEFAGRDSLFLSYRDVQRAVRTDRWKLIRYPRIHRDQLFDLVADPDERHDLAADPALADTLARLKKRLEDVRREFADPLPLLRVERPESGEFVPPTNRPAGPKKQPAKQGET